MAATPKRAFAVEKALLGQKWTEATVVAAMEKYAEDYTPLTDMRATAGYRALVAKTCFCGSTRKRPQARHPRKCPDTRLREAMNKHTRSQG